MNDVLGLWAIFSKCSLLHLLKESHPPAPPALLRWWSVQYRGKPGDVKQSWRIAPSLEVFKARLDGALGNMV